MRRYTLALAIGVLVGLYALLKLAISPPVPASVVTIYMTLAALAVLVFVGANEARLQDLIVPLVRVFDGSAPKAVSAAVLIAFPLALAWATWLRAKPGSDAPYEPRVIHPEPPTRITVRGRPIEIAGLNNPQRVPAGPELDRRIADGKTIYYQNCFFCHGDALAGDGHFAAAFQPLPANFRDVGTISMLQESFVFWRVATGGPGLPQGAAPWHSAMPAWQDFLTEDEIWKAILFIYAGSGSTPRTWEDAVDHGAHR
jgi:mono/diheme cytochrome c family protein